MLTCRHNGNQIIFRGMNDDRQREKLKSITFPKGKLTDVWLEEATEFTQADLEIIDDRLRGELPPDQFYQIRMTFNPVNKNHWIKKVFFDIPDTNVLTHHSTYLGNRFIDNAYRERMERRKIVDPEGYQIYGLGEWGEIGGLILHNWEVREVSQNLNDYDDVAIGQDFGFNHADAILLVGIKDENIYIIDEIYEHEKETAEIIPIAIQHSIPAKKIMWCDSAEPDRIKEWNKAGYRATGYKVTDVRFEFTRSIMMNESENIANEKTEADTQQVKINTILNMAAQIGDEQTLKALCDVMDWDFDELKEQLKNADSSTAQDARTVLGAIVPDDPDNPDDEPVEE